MAGLDLPKGAVGPDQEAIPITPDTPHPENYDRLERELPSKYIDSLNAELGVTFNELPTNKLANYIQDKQIENQNDSLGIPKLTAGEANAKYPYIDTPFTGPVDSQVAAEIADRASKRQELMDTIERGPQNGVARLSRWSAGMALGLADPLALGATIVGGTALGLGLKASGLADGAAAFMTSETPNLGQSFARQAIHGAVGGAAMESVNAPLSLHDQQDYSVTDAAKNIIGYSLGFSALHVGLSEGVKYTRSSIEKYLDRNPEAKKQIVEAATGQLASDRTVNVDAPLKALVRETDPAGNGALAPVEHAPIETAGDLTNKEFYIGARRQDVSLPQVEHRPIDGDFGEGVYLTDSPHVANGMAASAFSEADGKVIQTKINGDNVKLLNLDKPLADDVKGIAKEFLNSLGQKDMAEEVTQGTGHDVYHAMIEGIQHGELPETTLEDFNQKLADAGYDGIHYQGNGALGETTSPHNVAMLFDPEHTGTADGKITQTGEYQADAAASKGLSWDEINGIKNEAMSDSASVNHDPITEEKMSDLIKNPPVEWDIPTLNEYGGETVETLKALAEQGLLDEQGVKDLEELKEMAKRDRDQDIVDKAAMFCKGKDI